jgi:hypothetical protein
MTTDDLYTHDDDRTVYYPDLATVTRLMAALAPPYVGRARATGTRAKVAGICRDMEAMTFGYEYKPRHGAGVAK